MPDVFPPPLVPAEVDLTDFPFMPLDVRRLRDSRLVAKSSGDAFMAWMLLLCASWHQRPAGSLPDDDTELAQLAGFGRVVKEWQKVREGALYGWVKCSDGRLYHAHVAEKAIEAWDGKLEHQWRKECDRIRKENKRRETESQEKMAFPSLDEWKAKRNSACVPPESSPNSGGIPPENPLIGTGTGTGTGINSLSPDGDSSGEPDVVRLRTVRHEAGEVLAFLNARANRNYQPTDANLSLILARLKEGYTPAQCRQVVVRKCRDWLHDDRMSQYLRPATLFNREKFNQYAGELVAPKEDSDGLHEAMP